MLPIKVKVLRPVARRHVDYTRALGHRDKFCGENGAARTLRDAKKS